MPNIYDAFGLNPSQGTALDPPKVPVVETAGPTTAPVAEPAPAPLVPEAPALTPPPVSSRGAQTATLAPVSGSVGARVADFAIVEADAQDRSMRMAIADMDEAATGVSTEEMYARWETAKALASTYGRTPQEVFSNLDAYTKDYFGGAPDYKTAPKAIFDAGMAQVKSMERGRLYSSLLARRHLGAEWLGVLASPEEQARIEAEIAAVEKEMKEYQTDVLPRAWTTNAAKLLAGAIPYTADIAAKTALTAAAIPVTGGGSLAIAGISLRSAAVSAVGFTASARTLIGSQYGDMLQNGFDEDVAASAALFSGIAQAASEQLLGLGGSVAGNISKGTVGRVTERFIAKYLASGVPSSVASVLARRIAISTLDEMADEGIQSAIQGVSELWAQSIMEERGELGSIVEPTTAASVARDIATSMLQAAITAPFLGLPAELVYSMKDVQGLRELSSMAPVIGKDETAKRAAEILEAQGVTADKAKSLGSQVYDAAMQREALEATERSKAAYEAARRGEIPGDVQRLDSGALRTEEQAGEGGERVFVTGSVYGESQTYGSIVANVDDTAKTITITDSNIEADYIPLAGEMVQNIQDKYPGYTITTSSSDQALVGAVERFQAGEAVAPPMGMSQEESVEFSRISRELSSVGQGSQEFVNVGRALSKALGDISGDRLGFLRSLSFEATTSAELIAQARGQGINVGPGTRVPGAMSRQEVGGLIKNVISLAGDESTPQLVTTVAHELEHAFASHVLAQGSSDLREALASLYGEVGSDGKWDAGQQEKFVSDFEEWQMTSKAPSPEVENIFQRIGRLFREIYDSIKGFSRATPAAKATFDKYFGSFSGDVSPSIENTMAEARLKGKRAKVTHPVADSATIKERVEKRISSLARDQGLSDEDLASIRGKYSLGMQKRIESIKGKGDAYAARVQLFESGLWVVDPQLRAEAKLSSGEALSRGESDLLTLAANLTPGYDGEGLLFGEGTLSDLSKVPTDLLFSVVEDDAYKKRKASSSRGAGSFEEWLEEEGYGRGELSEEDKAFLRDIYDLGQGKVARKFQKGEFAATMQGERLVEFVGALDKVLYGEGRKQSPEAEAKARRIEAMLSRTPAITRAMARYHESVKQGKPELFPAGERTRLARDIQNYEGLYKYLAAVMGEDEGLAREAVSDLKEMPVLAARDLVSAQDRSISEMKSIVDDIREKELRDKIRSKEFTMGELDKYLGMAKEKATAPIKELASDMKSEAREGDKVARKWARELAAFQRLKAKLDRMRRYILRPVGARVEFSQASLIRLIQEYLRTGFPIDASSLAQYSSYAFASDKSAADSMVEFLSGLSKKPFSEWSIAEVEQVAAEVHSLEQTGRQNLRNKELDFGRKVKAAREQIMAHLASRKDAKVYTAPGSKERDKRAGKLSFKNILSSFSRPDAYIRSKLGDTAAKVLFDDTVGAERQKWFEYDRRVRGVNEYMASSGLSKDRELFKQVSDNTLFTDGRTVNYTVNDILGMRMLLGTRDSFNEEQRKALVYGNFFTDEEKGLSGEDGPQQRALANKYMEGLYEDKVNAALSLVDRVFASDPRLEKLALLMEEAIDKDADWDRFAGVMVNLTNKEPKKSKRYFPIYRVGRFSEGEDSTLDALNNNFGFAQSLDMNMAISRVNIQPRDQRETSVDAMKVFFGSIERQEHLVNMGPHVKTLKGIFSSSQYSRGLQNRIKDQLGSEVEDYINSQIDAITNPESFSREEGDAALRFTRGATVVSNLSWRLSNVLMQALTSGLPFLSEVDPVSLSLSLGKAAAYKGGIQAFIADTEEASPTLKHRQITPEQGLYEQRRERGMASALEVIGNEGMKPMAFVDRAWVAVGWNAIYEKQQKLMLDAEVKKAKAADPSLSDADAFAIGASQAALSASEYADRAALRLQPTSEGIYRAPAYRNMTAFKQLVLQFTQPLNVIFNNITYDVSDAIRKKEAGKLLGMVTAYALSGVAMGLIQSLRGRGPEPDDEEAQTRYWLHATTSQFTDSIPLVGNWVTGLTGYAIKGENSSWLRNDTNMPAFDLLFRGAEGLLAEEKDYGKIARNTALGIGMMVGAPAKAVDEMVGLIAKIAE